MRLITRSDFDGLVCGALLKEAGIIDHWKFAHPKDLQDGLVEINEDDCLANVPFVEGCGLWFDHHSSEFERNQLEGKYKGESRITPSCARIIYEYYGGEERFSHFNEMLAAVDILNLSDVQERIEIYFEQTARFKEMVSKYTRTDGDVIISDLRGVDPIYTGNRFLIYSMYPEQNISAWIVSGKGGLGCSVAVGYSVLNRRWRSQSGRYLSV